MPLLAQSAVVGMGVVGHGERVAVLREVGAAAWLVLAGQPISRDDSRPREGGRRSKKRAVSSNDRYGISQPTFTRRVRL